MIAKQSLLGLFQKNKKLIINMKQKINKQENTLKQLRVVYAQESFVLKDLTKKKSEAQEEYVELRML